MRNSKSLRLLPAVALLLELVLSPHLAWSGPRPVTHITALPPGLLLPVALDHSLSGGKTPANTRISATTTQRVLLPNDEYLPQGAHLIGRVVDSRPGTLTLEFTELRYRAQAIPIQVTLLAAASFMDVYDARLPLGATDRGTSNPADWTTRQIGGDEVYRSAGSGAVYNSVSDRVGFADLNGVYADPPPGSPRALPLSLGAFSSTARGTYGMDGIKIAPGGPAITLTGAHVKLHSGDALLLQIAVEKRS